MNFKKKVHFLVTFYSQVQKKVNIRQIHLRRASDKVINLIILRLEKSIETLMIENQSLPEREEKFPPDRNTIEDDSVWA